MAKATKKTRRRSRDSSPPLLQQFRDAARAIFGLDLRSLAVFRIALGAVLLVDLALRSRTLGVMYSEDGFFTRQLSFDYHQHVYGDEWSSMFWSVHWLSDKYEFQVALFFIAAIFAFLMMIGKWTRLATIVSWIMLASLHVRNPMITISGDFMLKMMLFWSIFLPLGAVWSMDFRRRTARQLPLPSVSKPIVSMATVAFVIQIICLYYFTGLAKWNEGWWSGDAMYHALGLDIYTTGFGKTLLEHPLLLKVTSIATVFAEVFLIWLLLVSTRNGIWRLFCMIVFCSFHIGILLSMSIGMFSWICMTAWLPLLPGFVWKSKNETQVETNESQRFRLGIVQQTICLIMLLLTLMWNVGNIESEVLEPYRSQLMTKIGFLARVDQHFQMFGQPPKSTPWFVYEAVLDDGSEIDLLTKTAPINDPPVSMLKWMPNFHWRKLHRNLVSGYREPLRQKLAEYQVSKWNQENENKVKRMRMLYFSEATGPDRENLNRHSRVWAVIHNEDTAGSLFDKISDDDKQDPLNLGF